MRGLFLAASGLLWSIYGLYCFVDPGQLAAAAGVAASSATGTVAAFFRPALQRPALLCLAFLCAGLFMARLGGALIALDFSSYTVMGLLFELLSAAFATRLVTAMEPAPAARPGVA